MVDRDLVDLELGNLLQPRDVALEVGGDEDDLADILGADGLGGVVEADSAAIGLSSSSEGNNCSCDACKTTVGTWCRYPR